MQHEDEVYVGHMLDMAQKAVAKARAVDRSRYDQDENLRLALTHLLQSIGEAARKASPGYQAAHPSIPWAKIIGMRHRVVHDYLHVDYDLVWDVVTADLPGLAEELARLLGEAPAP